MNGRLSVALRRIGFVILALMLLTAVSGCYDKSVNGDASVYKFESWVGIAVIAAGLMGMAIGFLLRKWSLRYTIVLMGMGPLLILIIAPTMYLDKTLVDANHFEGRYGLWFDPRRFNLSYDELRSIHYLEVEERDSVRVKCTAFGKTARRKLSMRVIW